jgi:hypothetical protein
MKSYFFIHPYVELKQYLTRLDCRAGAEAPTQREVDEY